MVPALTWIMPPSKLSFLLDACRQDATLKSLETFIKQSEHGEFSL